jgi:hypothetical protein
MNQSKTTDLPAKNSPAQKIDKSPNTSKQKKVYQQFQFNC